MIELLCFILAVLASPFKSNTRLEAENAALRHQLIVLRPKVKGPGAPYEQRSLVLYSDVSMVSINSGGPRAHLPDQRAQFYLDSPAPSPRVRFPTPIAAKAGPMPPHQRFRLDNRYDLQDRWKPSIHLDEEPAVAVGRLNSTPHPAPQDDQLVSEHRIFRLKPALRLERGGQHGQKKPNQRDHDANLADSSLNKPG